MSPPHVLVVGATGTVGSMLVDALVPDVDEGLLHLVVATRRPESADRLHDRGLEVRCLDLDEAETGGLDAIRPAFRGIDRVFLLTGYDVRMLARCKVGVDAAAAEGVSHVVHLGAAATADTTIVHFTWHQLIDAYIERSGLGFTHLRPAAFMQGLPRSVTGPGVLTHYVGDGSPNWIDATDIAAVAATVLREPAAHVGHAYDLAAQAGSLHEVVGVLSEVTGRSWRYDAADPRSFFDDMVAAGGDPVYAACVRNVFERTRNATLVEPQADPGVIEAVTGRPATSLRRYLQANHRQFTIQGGAT